jgi:hypothetical protein
MHTLRHTNTTLFVTVLSACLGLLIAGVPAQINAQPVTVKTTSSELVTNVAFKQQSPEQARKLVASFNAMFSTGSCRERGQAAQLFYKNTQALADNDQVFIVTRLPRAALRVLLVEKPAAN